MTCEIQYVELPGLHPAPPPPCLDVDLLPPLPGHLLPDLQAYGAGELQLRSEGVGAGLGGLDVSLLVVVSPGTGVPSHPLTLPFSPGAAGELRLETIPTLSTDLHAEWSILLVLLLGTEKNIRRRWGPQLVGD